MNLERAFSDMPFLQYQMFGFLPFGFGRWKKRSHSGCSFERYVSIALTMHIAGLSLFSMRYPLWMCDFCSRRRWFFVSSSVCL